MDQFAIEWSVESRLVHIQYSSTITLETLQDTIIPLINMIDSSSAPLVHVLVNVTTVQQYPLHLPKLVPVLKELYSHPRLGWMIVYGRDDRIMDFLNGATSSMFKIRHRSFGTRAEAIAFLNDVDTTLPDLSNIEITTLP